jgi:hypothetical protein
MFGFRVGWIEVVCAVVAAASRVVRDRRRHDFTLCCQPRQGSISHLTWLYLYRAVCLCLKGAWHSDRMTDHDEINPEPKLRTLQPDCPNPVQWKRKVLIPAHLRRLELLFIHSPLTNGEF